MAASPQRFIPSRLHRRGATVVAVVLTLIALAAGGGVAAWLLWGGPFAQAGEEDSESAGTDWYVVEPRSFDLTVVASGEIDTSKQVEVRSEVSGRPAILWIVEEGTTVKPGDPLFKLNTEDIDSRIEEIQFKVTSEDNDLIAAQRELEIEVSDAESKQRDAEVKLSLARLDLDRWRQGEVPQRRRELDLALKTAIRQLERTERDLELSQQLYDQSFISLNELEDSEIEEIKARDGLATAKLEQEVYTSFEYVRDERQHQSDVEQAEAELARVLERNASKLNQMRSSVASKSEALRLRKIQLRDLERQRDASDVNAPASGTVIYASSVGPWWQRNNPITPGREVQENEKVILLPDPEQMIAMLKVHEAWIRKVEVGQPVSVRIDARPGDPVTGQVTVISKTAEAGDRRNRHLRQYSVRIDLPAGFDRTLKPGMSCSGEIRIGRVDNALAVPVEAIHARDENRFVYVPAGGGQVRRQVVELGEASETLVEVISGLSAGDQVLLRSPRPGETTGGELDTPDRQEDAAKPEDDPAEA